MQSLITVSDSIASIATFPKFLCISLNKSIFQLGNHELMSCLKPSKNFFGSLHLILPSYVLDGSVVIFFTQKFQPFTHNTYEFNYTIMLLMTSPLFTICFSFLHIMLLIVSNCFSLFISASHSIFILFMYFALTHPRKLLQNSFLPSILRDPIEIFLFK